MESIAKVIRSYIAENILFSGNAYPYADETSFLDEGVLDSMNVLQLVTFVEKQFDIPVDDQDIVPDNFDSVSRLSRYIARKVPPRNGSSEPH